MSKEIDFDESYLNSTVSLASPSSGDDVKQRSQASRNTSKLRRPSLEFGNGNGEAGLAELPIGLVGHDDPAGNHSDQRVMSSMPTSSRTGICTEKDDGHVVCSGPEIDNNKQNLKMNKMKEREHSGNDEQPEKDVLLHKEGNVEMGREGGRCTVLF